MAANQAKRAEKVGHTPGPWHWFGNTGLEAVSETVLCADCGNATCGRARIFVDRADADLIAAAPELLETLLAAENRLYNMTPADMSPADADRREGALFLIRNVLRKAKGEL